MPTAAPWFGRSGSDEDRASAAVGLVRSRRRSVRLGHGPRRGLTLKPVDVEGYEARDVLIAGGVSDGDAVVTLGVQKLDPGQKVRVVQALQY